MARTGPVDGGWPSTAMERVLENEELILRMVELSDLSTMKTLMEVPFFNRLIQRYKKSILKARHMVFTLPAGYGNSPALLVYRLPRNDADSATPSCLPSLRSIQGWDSLQVAEGREREIEVLLNAPFLRLQPGPGATDFSWPKLDAGPKLKLRGMLKRALYLCDVLRDMEACAIAELGRPAPRWQFDPVALPRGSLADKLILPASVSHKKLESEIIPVQTRRRQIRFLEQMSDNDLVSLHVLCRIAIESWHEVNMLPAHIFGNPGSSLFEKEVVFKETILRHGSWFLFGEVRGYGARAYHRRELLDVTHREVTAAVIDHPIQGESTLVATVNDELSKRFGARVKDLDGEVLRRVQMLIGATYPAFKNPPSGRGHGSAAT